MTLFVSHSYLTHLRIKDNLNVFLNTMPSKIFLVSNLLIKLQTQNGVLARENRSGGIFENYFHVNNANSSVNKLCNAVIFLKGVQN